MNKDKNFILEEKFLLALKNHKENNLEIAQNLYGQVLEINPNYFHAHNNLGSLLQLLGDYQKAIGCYEKAIQINPNNTAVYYNLAAAFKELGKYQKALGCYEKATEIDPNNIDLINSLSTLLWFYNFEYKSEADKASFKKLYLFLFRKNNTNLTRLTHNIKLLLLSNDETNDLLKIINSESTLFSNEVVQNLLKEELFHLMLQKSLIADIFLEKLLTKLRYEILSTFNNSNKNILKEYFHFIVSLAEQCWLNEYVYIQSEKENNLFNTLKEKIENDEEINELEIAILGCYIPLNTSTNITKKLLNYKSKNILFNDLIDVQINEPSKEKELIKSIKSFGEINDSVSKNVQEQYEEHPYPRWRYYNTYKPNNFLYSLRADIIPNKVLYNNQFDNPNVLIAGCGTGSHPILATRFKNAKILAIDLSLVSLAYANRKTEELKIKNIEYLHGDILQLKKLNKKFDVIESVGVLHHMKDPIAGLKVLVDILEPHGFLKLGLYSETARKNIVAAREFIKQKNYKNTKKDIQICRQEIINKKQDPLMQSLTSSRDFYSTSSVKDLLFHVQEHRFTIPEIAQILNDLNLEFLGFNSANPTVKKEFSQSFPDDKDNISLENWHQFEMNNPDTFGGMYQFWVSKVKKI